MASVVCKLPLASWPYRGAKRALDQEAQGVRQRRLRPITATSPAPEAAVEFLVNGGDMVMIAHHLEVADATFDAIKAAVESGRLPRARLDEAVSALLALP